MTALHPPALMNLVPGPPLLKIFEASQELSVATKREIVRMMK